MKHFQSKVLTAAILAALSGSAIAADVYEKSEVYTKSEVGNEITKAKTEVTTALESKITAAKNELETKLTAQNESGKKDIKKIKAAVGNIAKLLHGEEGNEENLGIVKSIETLNSSVTENQSDIDNLYSNLDETNSALDATTNALNEATGQFDTFAGETVRNIQEIDNKLEDVSNAVSDHADKFNDIADSLDEVNTKADEAVNTANEAKQIAEDTKNSVNDNVKAAKDAASEAKTSAGEAKKAAEKVTDIKKAAGAALLAAYKNAQDINGFKEKDTIYNIDENGKITEKEATAADVEADDFKGLGLKEVVAQHDQSLADLTAETERAKKAAEQAAFAAIENAQELNGFEKGDEIVVTDADGAKSTREATEEDVKADSFGGSGLKKVVEDHDKELEDLTETVNKNTTDIATKADKTELEKVSGRVTANETAIAEKADKANVYTKAQSDERFVKVENNISGLDTTTKGLDTRLTSAEKSITEHGTRLNGLDKAVSDLRKETRQGLAEQAALSGLFQPYNVGRFNVTAAVGGYKSESAVAIGTGFRFTENFAAKAGVAVGTSSGSSAAYHVGVNYEW